MIALNQGDFDRVFGELRPPICGSKSRSRSAFPDRSAAELRASLDELAAMVALGRGHGFRPCCWVSPTWIVIRIERDAVGHGRRKVPMDSGSTSASIRNGRLASVCEFELDDEDAAFAYAEERARATASRLAVTNRCERDGGTP